MQAAQFVRRLGYTGQVTIGADPRDPTARDRAVIPGPRPDFYNPDFSNPDFSRFDFIYTKNSARPGSDFTYTKNSARLRLRATLYEENLGGDATENGNFQRGKVALQGSKIFSTSAKL